MSHSRRAAAAWQLASSYASALLAMAKGLVLVPLYLRSFDLGTYGAYLASVNVVGLLGILDVGLSNAFYQRLAFAHGRGDSREFAHLTGSSLGMLSATAVAISATGWGIAEYVPRWINAPPATAAELALTFRLTVIGTSITIFNQGLLAVPSAWQSAKLVAFSRVGAQLVEIGVIVLSLFNGLGVVALGWGALSGGLLGLTVSLLFVCREWRRRKLARPIPDRASIAWLLSVGVPTLFSRIAEQIAANLAIVAVSRVLGPSAAAVFGITEKTYRLAQGFILPIAGSSLSGLSHLVGERGPSALLSPVRELRGLYTMVVSVVIPSILVVNRDFVTAWVGTDKFGGETLSFAGALAAMAVCHFGFLAYVTIAAGHVRSTAILTASEALLRVPLMLLCLWLAGPVGMVMATAATYLLVSVFAFPFAIRRATKRAPSGCSFINSDGLLVWAGSLCAAAVAAPLMPVASTWPMLVVKLAAASAILTTSTALLSPAARRQLAVIIAKASEYLRSKSPNG